MVDRQEDRAVQRKIVDTAQEQVAHASPFVVGARMALDPAAWAEAYWGVEGVGLGLHSYREAVVVEDEDQGQG